MPVKLERCISHLKAQGKSESSAYGICCKATGWKKARGGGWKNERTGKKFGGK